MEEIKKELKQIKIQVRLGIKQKEIKQQYGILLLDSIEKAINYTRCCKSDSELLKIDKYNEPLTGKKGTDISSSVGDSLDDF